MTLRPTPSEVLVLEPAEVNVVDAVAVAVAVNEVEGGTTDAANRWKA